MDYIEQYKLLYEIKPKYGKTSIELLDIIKPVVKNIKSILDYGCGKSSLIDEISKLGIDTYRYDPAIDEYSIKPNKEVDLIICTDVLQHVPIYDLDNVLKDIRSLSKSLFMKVKCTTHPTKLPNGEYANCTVYPKEWWINKIKEYYDKLEIIDWHDTDSIIILAKEDL